MFVKLGYEWDVFSNGDYMWLGNCLTGKLFEIVDNDKKDIAQLLKQGILEEELITKYVAKWEEFRRELEENYVIMYSTTNAKFKDTMVRGGTLVETSQYIKKKVEISRVAIQVNSFCNRGCKFCNADNEYPCMSCYSDLKENEIDLNTIKKFIYDINNIVIREVLLTGGNLNLSFNKVRDIIEIFNKRSILPQIYMISNSIIDVEKLEFIKNNKIILIINIVSNDSTYLKEMEAYIGCLNKYGIGYVVHDRVNVENNNICKNRTVDEVIRKNEYIVNEQNIGRTVTIDINSAIGIKNLCNYGKIMIDAVGNMKVCNEYNKIYGNVNDDNCLEIIDKLKEEWYDKKTEKKCEDCQLKKICTVCKGVIKKYDGYKKRCQFNAL